jgi:predicted lysophospholipase L1 biosynthesis ABC-type transport system permease subunit
VYYPQPLEANGAQIIVRVRGDADRARVNLEHALATVDSTALVEMHTLDESLDLQVYPFRAMYWVASALAAIALLLTTIGVYGVIGYLVTQRRKEFSIRIALGAAGAALVSLVLRESLRLALIGTALGLAIALCISRLFATVIFNLNTFDAFGYFGGIGLVLATCAFASYAPSRRAAAVDPADVLRAE